MSGDHCHWAATRRCDAFLAINSVVNSQPVTDLASFKTAYEAFRNDRPRDAVVMVALRDGREETIRIEPPR